MSVLIPTIHRVPDRGKTTAAEAARDPGSGAEPAVPTVKRVVATVADLMRLSEGAQDGEPIFVVGQRSLRAGDRVWLEIVVVAADLTLQAEATVLWVRPTDRGELRAGAAVVPSGASDNLRARLRELARLGGVDPQIIKRERRFRTLQGAEVHCGAGVFHGELHDVSRTGAFISTQRILARGEAVTLRLRDGQGGYVTIRGRVAREQDRFLRGLGVEFDGGLSQEQLIPFTRSWWRTPADCR